MECKENDSGLLIPAATKPPLAAPDSWFTEADWEPHRGCNGPRIEVAATNYGSVSFARHLGKPLSQELWNDLVHRLKIWSLWIIGHNEGELTVARWGRYATVYLDENENVRDITIGGLA